MKTTAHHTENTGVVAAAPFFGKEQGQPFLGGNEAFFNKVQTKLNIGQPGDKYEHEADAVADKVVQRLSAAPAEKKNATQAKALPPATPLVQTKCADCEREEQVQKKEELSPEAPAGFAKQPAGAAMPEPPQDPGTNNTVPGLQKKCNCGDEKEVRKKDDNRSATPAPPLEQRLSSPGHRGNPLPDSVHKDMGQAMGADFSKVRVHTGSNAAQMSRELNAQAFTYGSDIYFNEGKYNPGSRDGQRLLAHELAHTVQQGAAGPQVQRYPQAGYPLPSTPKQSAYYEHADDVVALQGKSSFSPGEGLGNYIASLWENGQDAPVNVSFGNLASGYIWVEQRGDYYNQACLKAQFFPWFNGPEVDLHCEDIAPAPENYYAPVQVIPLQHEAFKGSFAGTPVLAIGITNGFIHGRLGWITGKQPDDIEPLIDAASAVTDENVFLPLIFGAEYDGSNYFSNHFNNNILTGDLYFSTLGILHLPNQQELHTLFAIQGDTHRFEAHLIGHPIGLDTYDITIGRDDEGLLSGESFDLTLSEEWTGGDPAGEDGQYTVTGALRASYYNGILEVTGGATYTSARLQGEVSISIATESRAREIFAQHAPGNKKEGVPLVPEETEEDTQGPLALTAWGNMRFNLVKPEPNGSGPQGPVSAFQGLEGEGAFAVSPEGYVILAGRLKFPLQWLLTPPMHYQSDDADDASKHLFQKKITMVQAPAPFGKVGLKLGIEMDAHANLEPLELYEIEVSGVYSNHPYYRSEADITPRLYIAGNAGASLTITLDGTYDLGGVFTVAEAGGSLTGSAQMEAYIDAAPTVRKIWNGGNEPAQYALEGTIHTGGQLTVLLTGNAHLKVLSAEIFKTKNYRIGSWTLADFGAILHLKEFILGSGKLPQFDFSKMGMNGRQRNRLGNAVANRRGNKPDPGKSRTGGFTQERDGEEVDTGHYTPTPPVRPDHNQDQLDDVLEEKFTMLDEPHELTLSFSGTRAHPLALLEMASGDKEPVEDKIVREENIIALNKTFADDKEEQQLDIRKNDLDAIGREAGEVVHNAESAATEGTEPSTVAGFRQLDDRISRYGKKYNRNNLGELSQPQQTGTYDGCHTTLSDLEDLATTLDDSWKRSGSNANFRNKAAGSLCVETQQGSFEITSVVESGQHGYARFLQAATIELNKRGLKIDKKIYAQELHSELIVARVANAICRNNRNVRVGLKVYSFYKVCAPCGGELNAGMPCRYYPSEVGSANVSTESDRPGILFDATAPPITTPQGTQDEIASGDKNYVPANELYTRAGRMQKWFKRFRIK